MTESVEEYIAPRGKYDKYIGAFFLVLGLGIVLFIYLQKKDFMSFNFGGKLPAIQITGIAANSVSFTDWKHEGSTLTCRMTYHGGLPVNSIYYSAYQSDGLKLQDGSVSYPSLRKGESGKAAIYLGREKVARIVIDVNY